MDCDAQALADLTLGHSAIHHFHYSVVNLYVHCLYEFIYVLCLMFSAYTNRTWRETVGGECGEKPQNASCGDGKI